MENENQVKCSSCTSDKFCSGSKSPYSAPNVWTAPWCRCNPCCSQPFPPFPPQHYQPHNPFPPCTPWPCPPNPWPPFPPCQDFCPPPKPPFPPIPDFCPPSKLPFPDYCQSPKPCPPPKPDPKPDNKFPVFPNNCPTDMMWLLLGFWFGSSDCRN